MCCSPSTLEEHDNVLCDDATLTLIGGAEWIS